MNNKIMKAGKVQSLFLCFFIFYSGVVSAQKLPVSSYGLMYINSVELYQKSLVDHPEKQMISVSEITGLSLDLRYASDNNFMHQNLYPKTVKTTYLRKPAYLALDSACQEFARIGLILVVFDAYRPYSVTIDLWKKVKDERYAANPAKGSGHNRGLSIDLTLADAKTHKLLPMPTGFDNFSDSAYQNFDKSDPKRIANRELLKKIMVKYGFIPLFSEWWHYSWPETGDYEVLDLSFEQLGELKN